jgi:hypothetical protein
VHKTGINKRVSQDQFQEFISEGWETGREKIKGWDEESKKNQSEKRMGMRFSEEHKRNLSEAHKGISYPCTTAQGCTWIYNLDTGETARLFRGCPLPEGWQVGRKPKN